MYIWTGYERDPWREAGGVAELENNANSSSRIGPRMFSRPAGEQAVRQGGR